MTTKDQQRRKEVRKQFVRDNWKKCEKVFDVGGVGTTLRTHLPEVKELAKGAREVIGYSSKTVDIDILNSIRNVYDEIRQRLGFDL